MDILLVNKGLAPSREKAKALIMSGIVYVDEQKEDKPGSVFDTEKKVEVKGSTLKYVSRGGLKLEKAMEVWPIHLEGATCMDIGASTGGFTDCMLQNGAVRVYAVDSGRGQLDWKLRQDERVICMEKTNARYLDQTLIPEPIDFFSVDVSFISLSKILSPAYELLREGGQAVCLIKPQFEAGREKVGKKGVVRDRKVHVEVIESVSDCVQAIGFTIMGLDYSPIKGPEGNIEYLIWLGKGCERPEDAPFVPGAEQITLKAHEAL